MLLSVYGMYACWRETTAVGPAWWLTKTAEALPTVAHLLGFFGLASAIAWSWGRTTAKGRSALLAGALLVAAGALVKGLRDETGGAITMVATNRAASLVRVLQAANASMFLGSTILLTTVGAALARAGTPRARRLILAGGAFLAVCVWAWILGTARFWMIGAETSTSTWDQVASWGELWKHEGLGKLVQALVLLSGTVAWAGLSAAGLLMTLRSQASG
jgi:hypothetical protein